MAKQRAISIYMNSEFFMHNQFILSKQVLFFLALVLVSYPVSLLLTLFLNPAPLANILGVLSLFSYIATLLPGILKIVFPTTRKSKILTWLLKYRRHLGVSAFSLGLNHGVLLIIQNNLNLLDLQTYVHSFHGFSILLIFTLLAITSHDQAVKTLKTNWKKLHKLTYLVSLLLPFHILDKMSGHWTYLTPIAVLSTTVIAFLVIIKYQKHELINIIYKQNM